MACVAQPQPAVVLQRMLEHCCWGGCCSCCKAETRTTLWLTEVGGITICTEVVRTLLLLLLLLRMLEAAGYPSH